MLLTQLKTSKKWIFRTVAICLGVASLIYIIHSLTESSPGETQAASQVSPSPASTTKAALAPSPGQPGLSVKDAKTKAEIHPLVTPDIPEAGNLGLITALRARLEQLKVESEIAKLEETLPKKNEVSKALVLPEEKVSAALKPKEAPPVVVSVQGVDGKLSATVRYAGKLISLRPGDHFQNGVVSAVNRSEVLIKNGSNTSSLEFD